MCIQSTGFCFLFKDEKNNLVGYCYSPTIWVNPAHHMRGRLKPTEMERLASWIDADCAEQYCPPATGSGRSPNFISL